MDGRQWDFFDALGLASFLVGIQNLSENRVQSAQNDVNAANDKQASFLLEEIGKRLDAQDKMLAELLEKFEGSSL